MTQKRAMEILRRREALSDPNSPERKALRKSVDEECRQLGLLRRDYLATLADPGASEEAKASARFGLGRDK